MEFIDNVPLEHFQLWRQVVVLVHDTFRNRKLLLYSSLGGNKALA
jgi:hypothetical protein